MQSQNSEGIPNCLDISFYNSVSTRLHVFLLRTLHSISYYPNGKTLFKLFAFSYVFYHTHKYHHSWLQRQDFCWLFPNLTLSIYQIYWSSKDNGSSQTLSSAYTYLLPGGPKPVVMWLNLDVARNRFPYLENQDTIV